MRRIVSNLYRVCTRGLATTRTSLVRTGCCALALAAAVGTLPAVGQDAPAKSNADGTLKLGANRSEPGAIPACLEQCKLSAKQETQIKDIVGAYDASTAAVWKQFGNRYMQTIAMESALLAAIEDHLTDEQRQQVRSHRRKTARHEQTVASTNSKPNQAPENKDEATAKPATAAEESLETVGVALTSEQEAAADKVQGMYRSQLRSMNRDIQGMHTRLVSLEADKLVEIEKVLTKEQLEMLRSSRQNTPVSPKVAVSSLDLSNGK